MGEKEGSVQEHDYLIHIAEHNVCFSEFDEAMDILKSADRPLTMWFRRLNESSIAGIKAAKENADELFTDSDDENESKEKEKKKTSDTTDDSKKKNEIKPKAVVKPTVDFTKNPMVLAARAIMEALRRLALGNAEEQEDVRAQITAENKAIEKNMQESAIKIFGKKGKPTEEEVAKMTAKKKKAYDKSMKKCQALALKKERALKMTKMAKSFKKK